ncbi:FtsK/SpoIIIE domain-containing protein [Nonomuraea jabiensis]|uniref:FtsK/SpoIIIE domain-containing protein n=1 Tax=Nonomuraea jabiensis TaxID=882448 RepID=UPI00367FB580
MFKRLPGDEARNLVTTTPDTAVVFRPAVLKTPALVTLIIYAWRFLAALVRTLWRHPVASAVPVTLGALYAWHGWPLTASVLGIVVLALLAWGFLARDCFARLVGWRLLAWWRLMAIYRRHWQAVMDVSGLARRINGRAYMPRLVKVQCDGWADRITVRMLDGQAVKDWTDRTDNLTQGFGGVSCRIALIKGGRLLLTFPRSDPLASPIPDEPSVGPVEIGKQEDGQPLRLKVHGTHVLIAGATGAGKGSFLWDTIRGLLPAMQAGLAEIWALDPKLMELSFGN